MDDCDCCKWTCDIEYDEDATFTRAIGGGPVTCYAQHGMSGLCRVKCFYKENYSDCFQSGECGSYDAKFPAPDPGNLMLNSKVRKECEENSGKSNICCKEE
ncbi:MAG: hypothetical protein ACLFN5_02165 [bacterium]